MIRTETTAIRKAVALSLLLLPLLLTGCGRIDVMSELPEEDAVGMIVLLRQNGIAAAKTEAAGSGQDLSWTVSVAPRDASNAFLVLTENELPRHQPKGFADLFANSKLIPTETEEKALFLQAQAGELERTIESMPTVIDARVHIAIPNHDPLRQIMDGEKPPTPSASVYVKHWMVKDDTPAAARVQEGDVRTLVGGAIEQLASNQVHVVLKAVQPAPAPPDPSAMDPQLLFFPLAILTVVLIGLLIVMVIRNRSLSRQLDEASTARTPSRVDIQQSAS